MAHRIELNQLGIGGIAIVVIGIGAAFAFGMQQKVSRGPINNAILFVAGETYTSHVQCGKQARVKPSLLMSFVGIHDGQRVRIKGYNLSDASAALKEAFPGCKVAFPSRTSRALWTRFI